MKECRWTGPERLVPGHGIKTSGDDLTLPDGAAKDFQARGLVKIKTAPIRATTESKEGGE